MTKFCLAMEEHRRTDAGRVRTAKEFVSHFFSYDDQRARDSLFVHLPREVRGPILASWGIRGAKAALRDDDEKVKSVVHDALVAGDIDDATFEEGITAGTVIDWIPLSVWWSLWRNGKLSGTTIQKALATARELSLIDEAWFLSNVQGRGGKLKGTDVVCDTLSKDQIVAWIRKIHESGDGSPIGIVAAIGWDTILAKTAQDALLHLLDAFALKAGLVVTDAPVPADVSQTSATSAPPHQVGDAAPPSSAGGAANSFSGPEPTTGRVDRPAEVHATIAAPEEIAARAAQDMEFQTPEPAVAVPDMEFQTPEPAVAVPNVVEGPHPASNEPPSIPSVQERSMWGGLGEESPKLAEARAAMMKTLMNAVTGTGEAPEPWNDSEPPAHPSSLEWPDPPGMASERPASPRSISRVGSSGPTLPSRSPDEIAAASAGPTSAPTEELIPITEDDIAEETPVNRQSSRN